DRAFAPPRLALAEAALARGDFASALASARESVAAAPDDARVRFTDAAAGAALGDRAALAAAAAMVATDAAPAHSPPLAAALAAAAASEAGDALTAALAPHALTLPLPLVVALAERGVPIPDAIAARRYTLSDLDGIRRLALALQTRDAQTSARFAAAYSALGALPPP